MTDDARSVEMATTWQVSTDREANTQMLKEIPGLADTICLTLGNAIFIPAGEGDEGKPWKHYTLDVDGTPHLFWQTHAAKPRSVKPYPMMAFDAEGLAIIFKHNDPPPALLTLLARFLEYERMKEIA